MNKWNQLSIEILNAFGVETSGVQSATIELVPNAPPVIAVVYICEPASIDPITNELKTIGKEYSVIETRFVSEGDE